MLAMGRKQLRMKCSKRGCKSDKVAQSRFHPKLSYCSECQDFSQITEEEYEQLKQEGMLRYDAFQEHQKKRIEDRERRIEEKLLASKPRSKTRSNKRKATTEKKTKSKSSKKSAQKKKATGPACSDHPAYGVIRKPRTDCKKCWKAYKKKFPERVS